MTPKRSHCIHFMDGQGVMPKRFMNPWTPVSTLHMDRRRYLETLNSHRYLQFLDLCYPDIDFIVYIVLLLVVVVLYYLLLYYIILLSLRNFREKNPLCHNLYSTSALIYYSMRQVVSIQRWSTVSMPDISPSRPLTCNWPQKDPDLVLKIRK